MKLSLQSMKKVNLIICIYIFTGFYEWKKIWLIYSRLNHKSNNYSILKDGGELKMAEHFQYFCGMLP